MTTENTQRRRPPWLAAGLLCLVLGTAALAVGVPWTWLTDGGWPWTGSISHQVGGRAEATIVHPDGRIEVFRAPTAAQAAALMHRRDEELKQEYHLDTKIAAGRVLGPLGLGLVAAGGAILGWRFIAADRRTATLGATARPLPPG